MVGAVTSGGDAIARASGGDPTWTIAEIAAEFGVTHRTVRHYEELGLISPERRRRADLEQRRHDIEDALAELDTFAARCRDDLDRLR